MQRTHHTCTTIFGLGFDSTDRTIAAGRMVLRAGNFARYLLARPNSCLRLASTTAKSLRSWQSIAKRQAEHLAGQFAEMCLGLALVVCLPGVPGRSPVCVVVRSSGERGGRLV